MQESLRANSEFDLARQHHEEIWKNYHERIVIEKFREIIIGHQDSLVENLSDCDSDETDIWSIQINLHHELDNLFRTWMSHEDYLVVEKLLLEDFWGNNYYFEINKIINLVLWELDKKSKREWEEINEVGTNEAEDEIMKIVGRKLRLMEMR